MTNLARLQLFSFMAPLSSLSIAAEIGSPAVKAAEPLVNPALTASNFSATHTRANFTPLSGPTGPTHRVRADISMARWQARATLLTWGWLHI
jgi:hypothetical protein